MLHGLPRPTEQPLRLRGVKKPNTVSLSVGNSKCAALPLAVNQRIVEALEQVGLSVTALAGQPVTQCPVLVISMRGTDDVDVQQFTAYLVLPNGEFVTGWSETANDFCEGEATWIEALPVAERGFVDQQLRVVAAEHRLSAKRNQRGFRKRISR